jgi:ribosomal protein S18 acetylase RimI-like enzyme
MVERAGTHVRTPETMQIRPAGDRDYPALARLARQLQDEHVTALPAVFRPGVHQLPPERFSALLDDPRSVVYVADLDGSVVASAVVVAKSVAPPDRSTRGRRPDGPAGHDSPDSSSAAGSGRQGRRRRGLRRARIRAVARRSRVLRALFERVRGFVRGNSAIQHKRAVVVIESIVVDPAHRGAGIGRALIAEARRWADVHRADFLELTVWEHNADAIALYRSCGFETLSRTMSLRLGDSVSNGGPSGARVDHRDS